MTVYLEKCRVYQWYARQIIGVDNMEQSNAKQAGLIILGSFVTFLILGIIIELIDREIFTKIHSPLIIMIGISWTVYVIKKYGISKLKVLAAIVVFLWAGISIMGVPVSETKSEVPQSTTKKASSSEHFMLTEDIIQKTYNQASQAAGVGSPKVDCSLSSYYENNIDGLIYVKGEYTLSDSKATHTYNARYGAGSNDMVFLALDGKTIFFDENKQAQYMDKK